MTGSAGQAQRAAATPARVVAELDALFAPRSIAIVGASNDERRFGGRPLQYLQMAGYAGPIYPINPNRAEVQGLPAFTSITAVGQPIDCAIISVSAEESLTAVRECAAAGVRSAVLFSPGFAEIDAAGRARQVALVEVARTASMRLLGPNCMGYFNVHADVYATFAYALEAGLPPRGRIGLVSQSGGYGGYVLKHTLMRGLGIAHWVTTGNESDVDLGEVLLWLAGRDDIDVILAYMEGARDGARLRAALDLAQRRHKPVVVMKVGRTDAGQAAARSHTAALAGSDAVYDTLFRQYGVYRARTTDEMLDVAYALSKERRPNGRRVGVVSISGGIGVQIADFVSDARLTLPEVPEPTRAALKELIPFCSPNNPVDLTGLPTANPDLMEKALDILLAADAFDAVIIFLGITAAAESTAEPLRQALAAAYSNHPDKLLLLSVTTSAEMVRAYDDAGMFVFGDPSQAVTALAALAHFADQARMPAVLPVAISDSAPAPRPTGRLNELEAKALLAATGLRMPREQLVGTAEEAAAAAAEIGFPVALKVVSRDIAHKTDCGGVALGLGSQAEVAAALRRIDDTVRRAAPNAGIDGYAVAEMVCGGVECIIGVHRDPTFGPVLTVGLGGVTVELLKDVARRLVPVGAAEVRSMLEELKCLPLLTGFRGGPAHDVASLSRVLVEISRLAAAWSDHLESMEVNPVRVMPETGGIVALDAAIEWRDFPMAQGADDSSDNDDSSENWRRS